MKHAYLVRIQSGDNVWYYTHQGEGLPHGEPQRVSGQRYSYTTAASVARDLLRSYPGDRITVVRA